MQTITPPFKSHANERGFLFINQVINSIKQTHHIQL